MLFLVFVTLFASCLTLWSLGLHVWLVFAAALATWIAFTFFVYPKVRTYKTAMGLDDKLNAAEATGLRWLSLRIAGFKVLLLGFVTSMVPFIGAVVQWLSGQNINFFFDPNNPAAQQRVMFVIGAVAFALPFVSSWLHLGAIKDAAETQPASTTGN